jgi:hypothetical protein
MSTKIQVRRGTAAQWTSANPTLAAGEIGFETDTGKLKIGTGSLAWNSASLLYVTDTTDFVGLLSGASGGTGVANTGKTITLGGNLTTSGAFATTLTATGTTSVTLPTSGTLLSDAALVTGSQGGTGVNNSGKTITLGGNLTTSGATTIGSSTHTVALNTGANTTLTLPTAGTLATLTGNEALTTKTYNGLSLTANATGFSLAGGTTSKTLQVNNTLTFAGTDATTMTFPAATGTVVTKDSTDQLTNKTFGSNSYSTTQTLTIANDIVFISATAAWTLTLPTPTAGKIFHIVRTDSTAYAISVAGTLATGWTSPVATWFPASTANKRLTLVSNGTSWYPFYAATVA